MNHKYQVGAVVRLKPGCRPLAVPAGRENNKTATIAVVLSDVPGGYRMDRDLGGCLYWNEDALEPVPNVAWVGLVQNPDKLWRVSLRNVHGFIIKDDTGEYEMSDHPKRIAEKEAKRLAKFYEVEVRVGRDA